MSQEDKCEHGYGWFSNSTHHIFVNPKKEVIFLGKSISHGQQVKMICNLRNMGCKAWRYAYFNKNGSFRKFGAIHNE